MTLLGVNSHFAPGKLFSFQHREAMMAKLVGKMNKIIINKSIPMTEG